MIQNFLYIEEKEVVIMSIEYCVKIGKVPSNRIAKSTYVYNILNEEDGRINEKQTIIFGFPENYKRKINLDNIPLESCITHKKYNVDIVVMICMAIEHEIIETLMDKIDEKCLFMFHGIASESLHDRWIEDDN